MNRFLLIGLTCILLSCRQQPADELIVGTWQCYERQTKDGDSGQEPNGEPYTCNYNFTLRSDGTGTESVLNFEFRYEIADTLLALGNRLYIVEELSQNRLILLDYWPDPGLVTSSFRQFFEKVEKPITQQ
jgi:hypothetical protein